MELRDDQLLAGLSGMTAGLSADGYTVGAHWTDEGRVAIEIGATPDACPDCLAPDEVMRNVAATMLTQAGIGVAEGRIDIAYPPGSQAH